MTEHDTRQRSWSEPDPELEKARLREIRDADNPLALQLLVPAFEEAFRDQPPKTVSGLVEMQRHLQKLRKL